MKPVATSTKAKRWPIHYLGHFVCFLKLKTFKTLNGLLCADVRLLTHSLTHSHTHPLCLMLKLDERKVCRKSGEHDLMKYGNHSALVQFWHRASRLPIKETGRLKMQDLKMADQIAERVLHFQALLHGPSSSRSCIFSAPKETRRGRKTTGDSSASC